MMIVFWFVAFWFATPFNGFSRAFPVWTTFLIARISKMSATITTVTTTSWWRSLL